MTKIINAAEFEALKAEAHDVTTERDVEHSYENLLDADGEEIAFATYRTGSEPVYTAR